MKFGMILIYNWITGLILFPVVITILYAICRIKFGKEAVNDSTKTDISVNGEDFCYAAIGLFLWFITIPYVCYEMYNEVKQISEIKESQKNQTL